MKISVLAVDDERVFLDFISQMELWKKENFRLVRTARGAEEALKYLGNEKVDVVLLDEMCIRDRLGARQPTYAGLSFPFDGLSDRDGEKPGKTGIMIKTQKHRSSRFSYL